MNSDEKFLTSSKKLAALLMLTGSSSIATACAGSLALMDAGMNSTHCYGSNFSKLKKIGTHCAHVGSAVHALRTCLFTIRKKLTFYFRSFTGIPISRPVAGVACGLVTSSDGDDPNKTDIKRYQLMTDILVRRMFLLVWGIFPIYYHPVELVGIGYPLVWCMLKQIFTSS